MAMPSRNDALAEAFASLDTDGDGTLGANELQVFLKRNFGHSTDPGVPGEMLSRMTAAEEAEHKHGAPPPPPAAPRATYHAAR